MEWKKAEQPSPEKPNTKVQEWVRKPLASQEACRLEEVQVEENLKEVPEEDRHGSKELWKEVTERITRGCC